MFIQVDESWENDGLNNREGNLLIDQIVESDVSSIILYMQYCSACLVLDFESEARGYDLSLCDHMILSCIKTYHIVMNLFYLRMMYSLTKMR